MSIARKVLCWVTSLVLCTALFPSPINGNGFAWASTSSLSQAQSDYESEPNDDMDQADTIRPGVPFIGSPDLDILTFTLEEPSRANIRLTTSSRTSYQLYDGRGEPYRLPNGNTVNGVTPSGGPIVTRIPCESLPAGTYYVHLYAAGTGSHGESYEVLLELGDDGVDYESEPNDDMDQADTIRPGVPFIGSPDLDILTFTLEEPSRANIRLTTSSRTSYQLYDGRGEPYRLPNGNTVNGVTPSGGPIVTRIPCESLPAGTYYVHLYAAGTGSHGESYEVLLELGNDGMGFDSALTANLGAPYRTSWSSDQKNVYSSVNLPSAGCLKIEMSKPESSYPVMEVYDTSRNLVWSYNARDEANSSKSTYSASVGLKKGTYYVCLHAGTTYISKTLPFTFTLTHKASTNYEIEPNGNAQQATPLKLGVACSADIGNAKSASDKDFFKFTGTAGKRYDIILAPREGLWDVSDLYHVDVYDAAGNFKDCSSYDSLPNGTKRAVFQPTVNGTYYIKVGSFSSEQIHYSITVNAFQKKTPTLKVKSSSIRRNYWKTGRFSNQVTYNGDGDLTYRSSNDKVVSVYHDGTMLTWGFGTATITVTAPETENYKGATTSFKVHVVKPSSGFKYARKSIKVPWSGSFSNRYKNLSGGKLTHKSSNKKVATINSKGLVTFKGIGATTITTTQAATSYYAKSSATYTLKIVPDAPKIKTIKAGKGSLKVRWRKLSAKQSSGYEVRCATTKSMKKAVKKTVKGAKKSSLKVSKLKKGKKYYVQVRAYKKVGGKTYYSSWSKAKTVKTKK